MIIEERVLLQVKHIQHYADRLWEAVGDKNNKADWAAHEIAKACNAIVYICNNKEKN